MSETQVVAVVLQARVSIYCLQCRPVITSCELVLHLQRRDRKKRDLRWNSYSACSIVRSWVGHCDSCRRSRWGQGYCESDGVDYRHADVSRVFDTAIKFGSSQNGSNRCWLCV